MATGRLQDQLSHRLGISLLEPRKPYGLECGRRSLDPDWRDPGEQLADGVVDGPTDAGLYFALGGIFDDAPDYRWIKRASTVSEPLRVGRW